MRSHTRHVAFAFAIAVASALRAQGAPVTLDQLVPAERQKELGLDTLSPEQRAGVVLLLQEVYQLGLQEGQKPNGEPQATPGAATPSVIETQIDGEFEGWEGETIVKLMNGQIWQQTDYYYYYHYAYMPSVLVYRSGGGYKMKINGIEKAVGVQRLR